MIEAGVHRDVPFETYVSWDAANASTLNRVLRSPAHAMAEQEESDAMRRGTAAHAAVLTPDEFARTYAVGPDVKLNVKAGKDAWQAFVDANPGKIHLRGADGEFVMNIRRAVRSHPIANDILNHAAGNTELSIVWTDEASGVLCKARIDIAAPEIFTLADLKCLRDARPDAVSRDIYSRGYHRSAAHYLRGMAAVGMPCDAYGLIVAENDAPHAVQVYQLDQDAIEAGDSDIRCALDIYKECKASGAWPGYAAKIQTVGLPRWAEKETA